MTVTITGSPSKIAAFNAGKYIRKIRNAAKREYAHKYFLYILKGRIGLEPQRMSLSYMAAQAVRMNLEEIYRGVEVQS